MLNKDVNEKFGVFKYMIPWSQTIQITLCGMILPKGNLISFQDCVFEVTIPIYDTILVVLGFVFMSNKILSWFHTPLVYFIGSDLDWCNRFILQIRRSVEHRITLLEILFHHTNFCIILRRIHSFFSFTTSFIYRGFFCLSAKRLHGMSET